MVHHLASRWYMCQALCWCKRWNHLWARSRKSEGKLREWCWTHIAKSRYPMHWRWDWGQHLTTSCWEGWMTFMGLKLLQFLSCMGLQNRQMPRIQRSLTGRVQIFPPACNRTCLCKQQDREIPTERRESLLRIEVRSHRVACTSAIYQLLECFLWRNPPLSLAWAQRKLKGLNCQCMCSLSTQMMCKLHPKCPTAPCTRSVHKCS